MEPERRLELRFFFLLLRFLFFFEGEEGPLLVSDARLDELAERVALRALAAFFLPRPELGLANMSCEFFPCSRSGRAA